ncbi:MAG: hypothetical protein IJW02_04575 [Clostridia bacterium]|nr:hypothetical protein [Clostridia bacterium]
MKKGLKILALTAAIALIAGVLLFANSLVGNPLSKALAQRGAEKYIDENYGDTDYELLKVEYDLKDLFYHATVSSPSSRDTVFTLMINSFGKVKYDNFDIYVEKGWSTATRLATEYRNTVKAFLDSGSFPYNASLGYGELVFVTAEDKESAPVPAYALVTNELTLDAYYNVNELGKQAGRLTLYIDDATVSAERAAEILLGIREAFDKAGIGFYAIDLILEYPQGEGDYEYGTVEVCDFLYSDIYEDGLTERVTEADKAAKNYLSDEITE